MIHLASIESLLGSVWAVVAGVALGYLAGNVIPVSWIMAKIRRGG